jgi:membrane protease YdiL (CAAX protease family)
MRRVRVLPRLRLPRLRLPRLRLRRPRLRRPCAVSDAALTPTRLTARARLNDDQPRRGGIGWSGMPHRYAAPPAAPGRSAGMVPGLLAGFTAAVGLRVAIGGGDVAASASAGLAFAAALAALTAVAGILTRLSWRAAGVGLSGAAVLCLPTLLTRLAADQTHRPGGAFWAWAVVVAVVATAEEAFLRGALFDALDSWRGPVTAIAVTAVCFAALHVPLYGWHVVPLDAAAGVWLGVLRGISGSWTAPAIAHTAADLAAWWLR